MHPIKRSIYEFSNLLKILSFQEKLLLVAALVLHFPSILKTRRLTSIDRAMSRDMIVHLHGRPIRLPIQAIDVILSSGVEDSYTFGTVREMFGNDVYLRAFRPDMKCSTVLDLGCNRGIFSADRRKVLKAQTHRRFKPLLKYGEIHALLAA